MLGLDVMLHPPSMLPSQMVALQPVRRQWRPAAGRARGQQDMRDEAQGYRDTDALYRFGGGTRLVLATAG